MKKNIISSKLNEGSLDILLFAGRLSVDYDGIITRYEEELRPLVEACESPVAPLDLITLDDDEDDLSVPVLDRPGPDAIIRQFTDRCLSEIKEAALSKWLSKVSREQLKATILTLCYANEFAATISPCRGISLNADDLAQAWNKANPNQNGVYTTKGVW